MFGIENIDSEKEFSVQQSRRIFNFLNERTELVFEQVSTMIVLLKEVLDKDVKIRMAVGPRVARDQQTFVETKIGDVLHSLDTYFKDMEDKLNSLFDATTQTDESRLKMIKEIDVPLGAISTLLANLPTGLNRRKVVRDSDLSRVA